MVLILWLSISSLPGLAASSNLANLIQDSLSESILTFTALNDGDLLRFGVLDFDPNKVLKVNSSRLGSAEASARRQSIENYSVPYSWNCQTCSWPLVLRVRASYVGVEQREQIFPSAEPYLDTVLTTSKSITFGASSRQMLGAGVGLQYGLNLHYQTLENDTHFATSESRTLRSALDGLVTNYKVDAMLAEPNLALLYDLKIAQRIWRWRTSMHYLGGEVIDPSRMEHRAKPEGWFVKNGFTFETTVPFIEDDFERLWYQITRVDLGADLSQAFGKHYYYETTVAWIFRVPEKVPLIDDLGIGISLNYGSSLKGGSVVLLLNEL